MTQPATRPAVTEPKIPHETIPRSAMNAVAIPMAPVLNHSGVVRAFISVFMSALSPQRTMRQPTIERRMPMPAIIMVPNFRLKPIQNLLYFIRPISDPHFLANG